jgi:hypothetical protein
MRCSQRNRPGQSGFIFPGRDIRIDTRRNRAGGTWAWSPTRQHITASPSTIGGIARAALVLTHAGHGYIT